PRPSSTDTDLFANLPAQAAATSLTLALETGRVCVDANEAPMFIRSGEIVALSLSSITTGIPLGTRAPHVQWAPAYDGQLPEFQLRAIHLAGNDPQPNHTYHVTSNSPAQGHAIYSDAYDRSLEINGERYPTYTALPRPGGWLLVATAPPTNWGCFFLTAYHMHDTAR
ncbi:MAG: hypothetical protein HOH95_08645, partial [Dehalococcoidia bacterium]|nr:hypothetical protein [Dehalococcoidia bacterium]